MECEGVREGRSAASRVSPHLLFTVERQPVGPREGGPHCSLPSGLKAEIAQPLPSFVITRGPWCYLDAERWQQHSGILHFALRGRKITLPNGSCPVLASLGFAMQ